ncbi:hypothetical protein [Helicobacter sp. 23-1045]
MQNLATMIIFTHPLTPSAREGEFLDSNSARYMKIVKTPFTTTIKTLDCHDFASQNLAMTRRGAIHFAMTGRDAICFAMTEILRHIPLQQRTSNDYINYDERRICVWIFSRRLGK